jgi:hypothetical protein
MANETMANKTFGNETAAKRIRTVRNAALTRLHANIA